MVDKTIGGNRNKTDTVYMSDAISLNASVPVTIAAIRLDRMVFMVNNPSNKVVLVKYQAATVVNDKVTVIMYPKSYYEMSSNIYTGEVSAITANGTADVFVTDY